MAVEENDGLGGRGGGGGEAQGHISEIGNLLKEAMVMPSGQGTEPVGRGRSVSTTVQPSAGCAVQ